MIIKLDFSSYGMCAFDREKKLYISGRKNKIIDLSRNKTLAYFESLKSIDPQVSSSGKYIAFSESHKGIEVIDRTNENCIIFKIDAHQQKARMSAYCTWHKEKDILIYSINEQICWVDINMPAEIHSIFDLDNYNERSNTYSFIKSFDVINDDVFIVCYRLSEPCFMASVNIFKGNPIIRQYYRSIAECPDKIAYDMQDGYYTLANKILSHHSQTDCVADRQLNIDMGLLFSISHNGSLLACSHYPKQNKVSVYNAHNFELLSEIAAEPPITSIAFSDLDHYLLISGKKAMLVEY